MHEVRYLGEYSDDQRIVDKRFQLFTLFWLVRRLVGLFFWHKPVASVHCCQMHWNVSFSWQSCEDGQWKDTISISVPALWNSGAVYASPVLSPRPGKSWNLWKSHWNGLWHVFHALTRCNCRDSCFFWRDLGFQNVFCKTGQVSEPHMWSSELAHRLWGEKKTGKGCSYAERRRGSFFCCSVLLNQLLRWAWLDHQLRSEESRTWLGVKVKGKAGCDHHVGFQNSTDWFFIRTRNWRDRNVKNDWRWSEATFS